MATALGVPWQIDPGHAGLVLHGLAPLFALCVNPATTAGLTVAYELELRGAGRLSLWPAITLGLISAGGRQPELALRFGDLFIYP